MIDSSKYGFAREYKRLETIQMDELAESGSLQLYVFTVAIITQIHAHDTTNNKLHNYNKYYGY